MPTMHHGEDPHLQGTLQKSFKQEMGDYDQMQAQRQGPPDKLVL